MSDRPAPRVAVVIPCFNDGAFVEDAVASALDQEDCELVVVDDGSSEEDTLEVLAGLERGGIRVIHQENGGLSAARSAGVAGTSAPYVHPLDADDRLASGVLTAMADILDRDPTVAAVWGDVESFGMRTCRYKTSFDLDPWRITYLNEPPMVALLRRSAIMSVNAWDMGSGYEDWDFWMKGAERGWKCARISRPSIHYREHPDPRMYIESRARHDELLAKLRSRHAALYGSRRANWRRSRSRRGLKLAWPLIDRLPLVPELRKESLYVLARDLFEPWMSAECEPGAAGTGPRHRLLSVVNRLRRTGSA